MMTDILKGVLTNGTGRGLALDGMPCAGKTGTTNENKDGWFVGYTRYYTTSVWVGYDMPKKLSGLSGASYPGRIWKTFMQKIHEGLEPQEFLSYESGQPKTEEAVPQENPSAETPENTTDQNQETKPIDIQGNVTEKPENKKDNKSSEDQENPSDSDNNQNDQNPTTNPDDNQQPENPTENQVITRTRIQRRIRVIIQTRHQRKTRMRIQIRIGQKRIHRKSGRYNRESYGGCAVKRWP